MIPHHQELIKAVRHHQAGDLDDAEQLYRKLLQLEPFHARALHLLGSLIYQRGRFAEAIEFLNRAIAVDDGNEEFHTDLGSAYNGLGQLDMALECFQMALQINPDYVPANFNLGVVLYNQGNLAGAQLRLERALKLMPTLVPAWNSLGNVFQTQQRYDDAARCYIQAADQAPRYADARFNLGNVRLAQGRLPEATACYAAALRIKPDFVEALNNLGTVLTRLGQFQRGIESYRLAIHFRPGFMAAHNNLGACLNSLGQLDEAEASYRQALALSPNSPATLNNLGAVFNTLGKTGEAIDCFHKALSVCPGLIDAWGNLGVAHQIQGQLNEAEAAYGNALRLQPTNNRLRIQCATMLPPVYDSRAHLEACRERFVTQIARLRDDQVALDPTSELLPVNFYLAYQGLNDRDLQRTLGELYGRHIPRTPPVMSFRPRAQDRRVRIGFVSKFFRNHTIGTLTRGLMAQLSRTDFHVTAVSFGLHQDETADAIRRAADAAVAIPEQIPMAREIVAGLDFDVLFYPDIGMDPASYTLAFSRLAPVQCVTWGHPLTTGIPNVDYFISSELLEPADAQRHYTEHLVQLKSLPVYYDFPVRGGGQKPREAFGLPPTGTLYVCPQSLFKFHPDFDAALCEILERDPTGRLVLIDAPQPTWRQALERRFARTLGQAGRVIFLPRLSREDYVQLLGLADVMLDTPHFGGGHTTFQGLAVGVPVVTAPGAFLRGRVSAACYRKMGVGNCVASNLAEYAAICVRLGTDADYRRFVCAEIERTRPVLYEDAAAVRELEQFFKQAVELARSRSRRAA